MNLEILNSAFFAVKPTEVYTIYKLICSGPLIQTQDCWTRRTMNFRKSLYFSKDAAVCRISWNNIEFPEEFPRVLTEYCFYK